MQALQTLMVIKAIIEVMQTQKIQFIVKLLETQFSMLQLSRMLIVLVVGRQRC